MQLNELNAFIKENSNLIYEYINNEVLKDVGKINSNYFEKIIDDMFVKKIYGDIEVENINLLPYLIFTKLFGKGKMDYTSFRSETIDFSQINKESKVYYNYAYFFLEDGYFCINLMQMKIGGMPIDKDIVKFSKKVFIKSTGLEDYINKKG